VAGLDLGSDTRRVNQARLYSADGQLAATYDKHHLIPGFESVDVPGTKLTVLHEASGTWGVEICKDMDFPRLSRRYGREGAGLLLVPAWDFVADGWLHGRMAILRGVESGFTVVRAAKEGRLTVSDDRGRVLAEANSEVAPFTSMVATAPVHHDRTLYQRWGDWFAWVSALAFVGILFGGRRKRQSSGR
jgi:apolipoprotein N-acyltransferase